MDRMYLSYVNGTLLHTLGIITSYRDQRIAPCLLTSQKKYVGIFKDSCCLQYYHHHEWIIHVQALSLNYATSLGHMFNVPAQHTKSTFRVATGCGSLVVNRNDIVHLGLLRSWTCPGCVVNSRPFLVAIVFITLIHHKHNIVIVVIVFVGFFC